MFYLILLQANSAPGLEGPKAADCILLQTGLDKTGRFQEAVGEAIAKTFKARKLAAALSAHH